MLPLSSPVWPQPAPGPSDQRMTGIPRKLHYIWFGGKPKSAEMEAVIDGWRKLMPECEVIEWNESNFDVGMHPWMKRMHEERRYAFASDYARFHVLKEYGGVYLDTDVVMKKSLAPFFDERCFFAFEYDSFLSTCIIAAEPGHPLIAALLAGYDNVEGPVINNIIVTDYFLHHYPEFRLNNRDQRMGDGVRVLPK
jgi:mannosyltransferase OCH1-like enzyme